MLAEFETPDDFMNALKGSSDYLSINLDIGHFYAAGFDPVSYIAQHHKRIVSLHIKDRDKDENHTQRRFGEAATPPRPHRDAPEVGMETFRIEVGHVHGVQPGNIVGAIANEADLESKYIGRIDIRDEYSLVDLPEGMPAELMEHLKKVRVSGIPLRIQRAGPADTEGGPGRGQRPHVAARGPRPAGAKPHAGGPRKPPFKPRPHRGS